MIAQADAVRIPLADQSVHCVVTSPPYWGLRKYAGEQGRIWGGDPECEHEWIDRRYYTMRGASGVSSEAFSEAGKGNSERLKKARWRKDSICECGAWYGGLGLEPDPERHVQNMVEVFREVKRVLRDDGVVWLNYGDCYASSVNGRAAADIENDDRTFRDKPFNTAKFAKAGSLMMMPHRVALALQADGWIVRQDLVWWKRNPMPESVNGWRWQRERKRKGADPRGNESNQQGRTLGQPPQRDHDGSEKFAQPEYEYGDDLELKRGSWRHTRAHEYVFMLTKKMQYFSNQEAVRESIQSGPSDIRKMEQGLDRIGGKNKELIDPLARASATTNLGRKRAVGDPSGRNPRSVLDVPTAPYRGAHYATFPPNLIAPLIRATCPRRCCPVCGQGWAAVVEKPKTPYADTRAPGTHQSNDETEKKKLWGGALQKWLDENPTKTLGYRPTCEHPHTQEEAVPGIVFDCFVGSGTTVKVAQDLLRKGIGIDISMEYLDLQAKVRIGQGSPSNVLDDLPLFQ